MTVAKIVDQDVSDKIDTQYVSAQFPHRPDVGITFLCLDDDEQEEDEWLDSQGKHQFIICLPYDLVKNSPDIRDLMVTMVKNKLGEVA